MTSLRTRSDAMIGTWGIEMVALTASCTALAVVVGLDGSPVWQVVRLAVVVVVGLTVAWSWRVRGRIGGVVVGCYGVLVTAVGIGFLPHLAKTGLTLASVAAVVLVVTGLVLVAIGSTRVVGPEGWVWRLGGGAAALVVTALVAWVVAPAVAATNVPPTSISATPADRGLSYESVTFTTEDGVDLAAWYVPAGDGAAVVLRHGAGSTRSSVLDEAEVLASGGVGVLLVDARGHGESGGRAMDFGWHGDADVAASVQYLTGRPDVDPDRIGLVGMSMGGEEAIGASDDDLAVRAVVAEGATARTAGDKDWLSDEYGVRGQVQEQLERLQYGVTDVLTEAGPPATLASAVGASGDTRFLLITAGAVADEGHAAADVAAAAPDRVEVWTVPGAGHTDGLETAPQEWAQRVETFLRAHL